MIWIYDPENLIQNDTDKLPKGIIMASQYAANYEDRISFNHMLDTIGFASVQRARIVADGFTTMKESVDHYKITGPKELERYLKDLNKTFTTAAVNTSLRVYYSPKLIKRLC